MAMMHSQRAMHGGGFGGMGDEYHMQQMQMAPPMQPPPMQPPIGLPKSAPPLPLSLASPSPRLAVPGYTPGVAAPTPNHQSAPVTPPLFQRPRAVPRPPAGPPPFLQGMHAVLNNAEMHAKAPFQGSSQYRPHQ